jgi:hypothetical protein
MSMIPYYKGFSKNKLMRVFMKLLTIEPKHKEHIYFGYLFILKATKINLILRSFVYKAPGII